MRNRFPFLMLPAVVAVLLVASGCKDGKRSGIFTKSPEPSMNGTWEGTLNTISSTATITLTMLQGTLDVDGTYTAPASQASVFGVSGIVEGVTTGESFLVTLTPDDPGCHANIQLGGNNSGMNMAFSFSGVDCSSADFKGQGYFSKKT